MSEIECKRQDCKFVCNIEGSMFGLVCSCTIVCTLVSFVLGCKLVSCSDKMFEMAYIFDTVDSREEGCRKVLDTDT